MIKRFRFIRIFFVFLSMILAGEMPAKALETPFTNMDSITESLGFSEFTHSVTPRKVRVAILDRGFYGFQKQVGKTLPETTKLIPGPVDPPKDLRANHGMAMAQILTSAMTNGGRNEELAPELFLYEVYGFSNFQFAVEHILKNNIDVVLFSDVWEYGGNSDGRGFVNTEVNKVVSAGILWINSAGNFHERTYISGITDGADEYVQLPNANSSLAFQCEKNARKTCDVRIVLSWNDFKDTIDEGTDKDLDVALTDDFLNIVQTSSLKQAKEAQEGEAAISKYPREIVAAQVKPGRYFIRVKDRSHNFNSDDRLRITVSGDNLKLETYNDQEDLLNPADNSGVITVGASDSELSSVSVSMHKPEISVPSSIKLNDKSEYRGASNSAAIVAAGAALLRMQYPDLSREQFLEKTSRGPDADTGGDDYIENGVRLSTQDLAFTPTGENCFKEVREYPKLPDYVKHVLAMGQARLVDTSVGIRVMTDYDPATLGPQVQRSQTNDRAMICLRAMSRFFKLLQMQVFAPRWAPVFILKTKASLGTLDS